MSNKPTSRYLRVLTDEKSGLKLADAMAEHFDADTSAVAMFEMSEGRWAVEVHCDPTVDAGVLEAAVAAVCAPDIAGTVIYGAVEPDDWVAKSLEGLGAVRAGRFIVHGSHARTSVQPNDVAIEIEAALAFGTGHHGTTRGCLLALDDWLKHARRGARVLDVGTGSGVLAIAAAKALRIPVLASDIDPQAVRVAQQNAHHNGVRGYVTCIRAAGFDAPTFRARAPFDLVFANILLGPLRALARPIAGVTAPQGRAVLSGLLPHQARAVAAACKAHGLALERRLTLEGWTTLTFVKRGRAVAAHARRA